jgi:uncharacterized protein (UPF0261 family)
MGVNPAIMKDDHSKSILIIATLDTKGVEVLYLKKLIEESGHKCAVMDTGTLNPASIEPDITRDEVAAAVGTTIADILRAKDKGMAIHLMCEGSARVVMRLYEEGAIEGVIGIGGAQGTDIGTRAMRVLPFGFPKLMVSTVASGLNYFGTFVGTKDLMMMHSVVDIQGLNAFLRSILANAAGAIVGMVEKSRKMERSDKQQIGMTIYGTTTLGSMQAKGYLESKGYEIVAFHPNGTGGQAMEEMTQAGLFHGILDYTTHELMDELVGGGHRAGPNRLEAAGKMGIPQVVAPGSVDFIIGPSESTLPEKWKTRNYVVHNSFITLVRANREEMRRVGEIMAEKLNHAKGPTVMMIPLRGFSYHNKIGDKLYDEEGNQVFIHSLKSNLRGIEIKEIDAHINDAEFALPAAQEIERLISR